MIGAKERILARLAESPKPLAIHELDIIGVSQNAAGTRLSELAAVGKVVGEYKQGARYKVWYLPRPGQIPLGP